MSIPSRGPRLPRIRGHHMIIRMALIQAISLKILTSLTPRISSRLLIIMKRLRDRIRIKLATASWQSVQWIELAQAPLCVTHPLPWIIPTSTSICPPTMQTWPSTTPCSNFTNLIKQHPVAEPSHSKTSTAKPFQPRKVIARVQLADKVQKLKIAKRAWTTTWVCTMKSLVEAIASKCWRTTMLNRIKSMIVISDSKTLTSSEPTTQVYNNLFNPWILIWPNRVNLRRLCSQISLRGTQAMKLLQNRKAEPKLATTKTMSHLLHIHTTSLEVTRSSRPPWPRRLHRSTIPPRTPGSQSSNEDQALARKEVKISKMLSLTQGIRTQDISKIVITLATREWSIRCRRWSSRLLCRGRCSQLWAVQGLKLPGIASSSSIPRMRHSKRVTEVAVRKVREQEENTAKMLFRDSWGGRKRYWHPYRTRTTWSPRVQQQARRFQDRGWC